MFGKLVKNVCPFRKQLQVKDKVRRVVPFAYEGDVEDGKAKDPTISDFFSIQ
jgi:hypothetical protein